MTNAIVQAPPDPNGEQLAAYLLYYIDHLQRVNEHLARRVADLNTPKRRTVAAGYARNGQRLIRVIDPALIERPQTIGEAYEREQAERQRRQESYAFEETVIDCGPVFTRTWGLQGITVIGLPDEPPCTDTTGDPDDNILRQQLEALRQRLATLHIPQGVDPWRITAQQARQRKTNHKFRLWLLDRDTLTAMHGYQPKTAHAS